MELSESILWIIKTFDVHHFNTILNLNTVKPVLSRHPWDTHQGPLNTGCLLHTDSNLLCNISTIK